MRITVSWGYSAGLRHLMAACVTACLATTFLASPAAAGSDPPLEWTSCPGVDNPLVRCAVVRVPLDYDRPRGRQITIMISRLAASDPAARRGVLLTTGGGPGGPGVPLPDELSGKLDARILSQYDLVGFDLRFVERSTPISCGHAREEPGGWWGRDASFTSFERAAADAQAFARDCSRAAGWALPYATTASGARDMDRIRAALGEKQISYLGGSYAAMLGSVYASMFPRRADRFVLDSPPDYAKVWRQFELERTGAMEENLAAFSGWVASRDAEYHLGTTSGQVSSAMLAMMRRANDGQLVIDGHSWTMDEAGSLIIGAVFFEQHWSYYAAGLAALAAGRSLPYEYGLRPTPLPGTVGVPADNHTAVSVAYRCGDGAWSRDLATYRRDLITYSQRYPIYGPSSAHLAPCAFWPVATGADRVRFGGHRAPGALVLAATRDASVPLANAAATATALAGSRLVTVDLRTHVPFLGGGANRCLTETVTTYLLDGRLPSGDVAC